MVGSVYLLHVFSGLSGPGLCVCLWCCLIVEDSTRQCTSDVCSFSRRGIDEQMSECNDEIIHVIVSLTHVIP